MKRAMNQPTCIHKTGTHSENKVPTEFLSAVAHPLVPGGVDLCSLPCGIKYKLNCLLLRQFPRRQFHNAAPCSALDVACICISCGFVQIVYLRPLDFLSLSLFPNGVE